jgi:UTP--glucose-1-phosphate uridylyltransferase
VAITIAVVPVAGLATRLRPLSRGVPKGLLPVAGKPVVQWVVDELAACGIQRVVLVTGRSRAAFAAHFCDAEGPEIVCAEQPRPRGLGDAILCAAPHVGEEPFAIALGDALMGRGRPARVVERLAAAVQAGASAALAVEEVAPSETDRYGIVVPGGDADPFPVLDVVEKPAPADAPSLLAVAGRYVATSALLDALRDVAPDARGEIQLAEALAAMDGIVAVRLGPGEERFDVGSIPGYCEAFVDYALSDPDLGPALRAHARALLDGER